MYDWDDIYEEFYMILFFHDIFHQQMSILDFMIGVISWFFETQNFSCIIHWE